MYEGLLEAKADARTFFGFFLESFFARKGTFFLHATAFVIMSASEEGLPSPDYKKERSFCAHI